MLFFDVYNLTKWFPKWNKKSADLIFHAPFHKPILSYKWQMHEYVFKTNFSNENAQFFPKDYFYPIES